MKAKVLFCYYSDGSGYQVVRVYFEKDFEQATKDYEMMCQFASDYRTWKIEDVEVFEAVSKNAAPDLLEVCLSAKAMYEAQGVNENSRIGGEQYKQLIQAINKAKDVS